MCRSSAFGICAGLLRAPDLGRGRLDQFGVSASSVPTRDRISATDPAHFVATMSTAKRRGRIFIDWLRNERGRTAVAPYSTRARDGAPVATPVSWKELSGLQAANGFSLGDVLDRLAAPDPWKGFERAREVVDKTMIAAVEDRD